MSLFVENNNKEFFDQLQNNTKITKKNTQKSIMITQVQQNNDCEAATKLLQQQYGGSKFSNKVHSINLTVMDHIFDEIQHENIVIPQEKKPFKLRKSQQPMNVNNELQLSQLMSKKQQIQNQLKKIQQEQYKLQMNQSRFVLAQSKISESRLNSDRMFRSQLTQEEKQKIKQVIKNQKKFIKELKQKEQHYQRQVEQDRLKNIEIQENIKKQKCQERKLYWEKIRNQVAKRQEQRKQKQIQDQNRLQQVKKSKKLYEILQNSWKNKAETEQNKIKEQIKHEKQVHKFDLAKIIEHEKQVDRIAKEKEQARLKNKQQFEEKVKLSLPKIQSKFLVTLKEEQRKKKIEQDEKERRRFQLSQKKNQFAQKVREQYKPRIDDNLKATSRTFQVTEKVEKRPGLPFQQVRNLGNDYMRKVHQKIEKSHQLLKETRMQNLKLNETSEIKRPLYKNYLSDLKQRRNTQQIKSNLTNEVHRIMKNSSYSTLEKIQRAKLVAKRLQGKQNTKSSALISSINEKMKILKVLNEDE